MAKPTNAVLPLIRSEPRTRTEPLLESIALRHQVAVLERSGTRRPLLSPLGSVVLDLVLAS